MIYTPSVRVCQRLMPVGPHRDYACMVQHVMLGDADDRLCILDTHSDSCLGDRASVMIVNSVKIIPSKGWKLSVLGTQCASMGPKIFG